MVRIEKCLFINRAPFKDNLEIDFQDGINVLCGINGRGKTTILSYIVDAIYEMARSNYPGSFEGKETKYYRVSSGLHLMDSRKAGIVYIRFRVEGMIIDYIDVRGRLTEADYNNQVNSDLKKCFAISIFFHIFAKSICNNLLIKNNNYVKTPSFRRRGYSTGIYRCRR